MILTCICIHREKQLWHVDSWNSGQIPSVLVHVVNRFFLMQDIAASSCKKCGMLQALFPESALALKFLFHCCLTPKKQNCSGYWTACQELYQSPWLIASESILSRFKLSLKHVQAVLACALPVLQGHGCETPSQELSQGIVHSQQWE